MQESGLPKAVSTRIESFDALRGFSMLWIIGVTTILIQLNKVWPNSFTEFLVSQMDHAQWEGFTFIDLIFPLFLFIVGLVLPFSILGRLEKSDTKKKIFLHVLKRTIILIIWGLINYGLLRFDMDQMRFSSVLGRIGICYFSASLLLMYTRWQVQAIVAGLIYARFIK